MAGKIATFCFRPAIEMIGFGGHRETASGLTSPTAAGKSPRPVAQGKDGKFPLLSLSNSEEKLTPIQEETRCEEGPSVPIRLMSSLLRLSFPHSQTSTDVLDMTATHLNVLPLSPTVSFRLRLFDIGGRRPRPLPPTYSVAPLPATEAATVFESDAASSGPRRDGPSSTLAFAQQGQPS